MIEKASVIYRSAGLFHRNSDKKMAMHCTDMSLKHWDMLGCALTCTHILVTDLSLQGEEHAGEHVTAISPPTQEQLLNMSGARR